MPDEAVERIIAAAKRANKPVCVMVGSQPEAQNFANPGATAFIISSDRGHMSKAAAQALADVKTLT